MRSTCTRALAVLLSVLLLIPSLPVSSQEQQQAGKVTAQIPRATIARPAGTFTAAPDLPVYWMDQVTTESAGRVRITLDDSSILNVGPDSGLQVVKHDAQTRQSEVALTYGKMRVYVQKLDKDKGEQFTVRTPTAVLGVIGTHFYVFAGPNQTIVIVYEGVVLVTNLNAAVLGSTQVFAGQQTVINFNQPPSPPSSYNQSQFQNSLDETNVGEDLPQPPKPPGPPGPGIPTWVWIAGLIGATVVMVTVPLATGGGSNPPQTPVKPPKPRQCRKCQ